MLDARSSNVGFPILKAGGAKSVPPTRTLGPETHPPMRPISPSPLNVGAVRGTIEVPVGLFRVATLGAHPPGFRFSCADRLARRVDGTCGQLHKSGLVMEIRRLRLRAFGWACALPERLASVLNPETAGARGLAPTRFDLLRSRCSAAWGGPDQVVTRDHPGQEAGQSRYGSRRPVLHRVALSTTGGLFLVGRRPERRSQ